jgi:2-polyprenyl-3-methyl-5-hydroxy-6-metoxy-1,4-benzoquinol methylase
MTPITNQSITHKCLICNSDAVELFDQQHDLVLFKCLDCGVVFQINPQLMHFEQAAEEYGDVNLDHRKKIQPHLIRVATERLNWIHKFIGTDPVEVLEIGAATGEFLYLAKQIGWSVSGIELSQPFIEAAARQYQIMLKREILTESTFPKESFDLIALFHVFEHLPDPRAFLKIARSLLKPNGKMALVVPNLLSYTDRFYGAMNPNLYKRDHLFHYSLGSLKHMLKEYGFKIIYCESVEPYHHIWTTMYAYLGKIRKRSKSVKAPLALPETSGSTVRSLLPYRLGDMTRYLSWPYRAFCQKTGRGHEIRCIVSLLD